MAKQLITGLFLRGRTLAWTTLRKRKSEVELVEQESLELEGGEEPFDPAADEARLALKSALKRVKGLLTLGVPTEHALLRVVELPSLEADELADMVELQVDKFSPFPVDQMAISWELLRQTGENSTVLIAAVRRDAIEELGGAFLAAGVTPHAMDVDVMGWWYLLCRGGHVAQEGRHILLLLDATGTDLVIAQDGVPIMFRSLVDFAGEEPDGVADELAGETGFTLTTLEADWGAAETHRLTVWHRNGEPSRLAARLRETCDLPAETAQLDSLPPLHEGFARRAAAPERTLDLAPRSWHVTERSQRIRKRLVVLSSIVLGIWLAGVIAFMAALQIQKRSLAALKARVKQVEEPAREVRQIMGKVRELEEYGDRTYSALECLREISSLLPAGVDLTSFVYKKGREVSLRGETDPNAVNTIYAFFKKLEGSPLFVSVENEKVTTRGSSGRRKAQFTVLAKLPAKEEEETP